MLPSPTSSTASSVHTLHGEGSFSRPQSSTRKWKYIRRIYKFKHMDFEFALWQMLYLCVAPRRVYRNFHYQKYTKNQWARDDPAFLVLLSLWLVGSCFLHTIILHLGFFGFIKHLLWVVLFDCILMGMVIATVFWFVVNRYMRVSRGPGDQMVEWAYSFDVHLNAFFPLLLILHILQVFLMHSVLEPYAISRLLCNSMWMAALTYYFYITFLGYSALPFTQRTVALLYPVVGFFMIYLLSLPLEWHFGKMLRVFYTDRVR